MIYFLFANITSKSFFICRINFLTNFFTNLEEFRLTDVMNWALLLLLLLISCLSEKNILSADQRVLSPGGKPMLFIGVFQRGTNFSSSSSYCQSAVKQGYLWREQLWGIENFQTKNLMKMEDFTYIEKVFDDFDQLTEIIVGLKLDKSYFVDDSIQENPEWNNHKIESWSTLSRIMLVVVFAGEEETGLLREILYGDDFPIVLLNNENLEAVDEEGNIHSSSDFMEQNAEKLMYQIATVTRNKASTIDNGVNYFLMVEITGDAVYKMELDYFYDKYVMPRYQELKRCHIRYRLNITDQNDIDNLIHQLFDDPFMKFVIVYGKPKDQALLYTHFRAYIKNNDDVRIPSMNWVFHDLDKSSFQTYKLQVPSHQLFSYVSHNYQQLTSGLFESVFESVKDELSVSRDLSIKEFATLKTCSLTYLDQVIRMVDLIRLFQKFDLFKIKTFRDYKYHNLRRIKKIQGGNRYFIQIIDRHANHEIIDYPLTSGITAGNTKCPVPYCGPGNEKYFGEITNNIFSWNNSFGWTCHKCAKGHFKSAEASDNSSCMTCPSLMITNSEQSACFDPYTSNFLRFRDLSGLSTITIAGTGLIFSLLTMAVFGKHRHTPFVRAFDLPNLFLHLISMLLSFVAFPHLFVGQPSLYKCYLQPISILVLSICPSIIILLKSQKILLLFKSKLKLSKGEQMRSSAKQVATALVIVMIDAAILFLLIQADPPTINITHDHFTFVRNIFCSNSELVNIQIAYLITLQLLSGVQAFRGRSLPGPFNEGLAIAYSTFVVVITYTVQFPMYYLQQDIKVRSAVHAVVLCASHLLFMTIYYGSKLHLVLVKRKRNTRENFRAQLMKKSRERAVHKLSVKT